MKKNLFLCLFALLGFLSAAAQTTAYIGFNRMVISVMLIWIAEI